MCDKKCHEQSCPFAISEESEIAQSYGCLPSSYEIVGMRVFHEKTWACHSNPSKPCTGALRLMKRSEIDCRIIDSELITEHNLTPELMTFSQEQHKHLSALMRKAHMIDCKLEERN